MLSKSALLALLPFFIQATSATAASGTGTTTRYWDCCKPSCAWSGKAVLASGSSPVGTCDINDSPLASADAASGCNGGTAYMCSDEAPWAVTDQLAYGYAAVNIAGGSEASWCCACYELTFTSGAVAGKKMIVQATNTGGDLGSNQFDISIPGGGVGIYNGCTAEWGAPSSGWGAQYGGVSSASACATFPTALQAGCSWRFDWFEGSDNPTVSFKQVACPAAITAKTGCTRGDDSSMPAADAVSGTVASASTSSAAAAVVESSTSSSAAAVEATTAPVAVVDTTTSAAPVVEASTSAAPVEATSSTAAAVVVDSSSTSSPAAIEATTTSIAAVVPTTFASITSASQAPIPTPSDDEEYWDGTCEL